MVKSSGKDLSVNGYWLMGGRTMVSGSTLVLSFYPFLDELVDFFSVNYTKDENTAIQIFKNHPIISNSQLPVSFKGSL